MALGDTVPYIDLLIRIGAPRPNSDKPAVEAVIDRDSLFYGGTFDLDESQLFALENDNAAYSEMLRKALFCEPVQRAYDRATAKAKATTEGRLRIRLQIDDEVAGLQAYRWERTTQLFDGQPAPLSTSTLTPFSRFAGLEGESAAPLSARRIRMAVCVSNPDPLPEGFMPVRVEDEIRNIRSTVGSLRQSFQQLQVAIAPGRTPLPKDLLDGLVAEGYELIPGNLTLDTLVDQFLTANIVHFLGHGFFNPATSTAALYLEKPGTGELDAKRDVELLPRITGSVQRPHLVVLMACEGARRVGTQPFVGLAGKLVKAGIPALLAMQTRVAMDDAAELTKRFYSSLLATGIVDRAANEGRSYLYDSRKTDYSIPALFMRLQNGQLLAPDPALSALKTIMAETKVYVQQPPLPIDVVHLTGRPSQSEIEQAALTGEPPVDLLNATHEVFVEDGRPKPNFVLLFGAQGTAKSTHVRRMVYLTASDEEQRIIPVYLNLVEYCKESSTLGDSAEEFLTQSLAPYWPGLTTVELRELLNPQTPQRFRFLVDGNDELSERQRVEVLGMLLGIAERYRMHQCLYVSDICYAEEVLSAVGEIVKDILVIKPISQNRAEKYLASLQEPAADMLSSRLQDEKLFDLAAPPWLLIRMLQQARRGTLPESRASVLKRVVDDLLSQVTADRGMRARAADAVYALAWAMHSRKKVVISLAEAFPIIEGVRGNRGFATEEFFHELVDRNLLTRVGQDRLRFAYAALQDYCCAQALKCMPEQERAATLDDITARLGRLTLLRWWDAPLIILSGLLDGPHDNSLIELILYGSGFGEGERIFLAARAIRECTADKVKPKVVGQVVDGLIWRSKVANEPRQSMRIRAVEELAGLQVDDAIPHLTALAADQVRKNYINKDDFEYPAVRLAATLGLMRMNEPATRYLWKQQPAVARTFELWRRANVEELGASLMGTPPPMPLPDRPSPSIAAFALGQIRTPRASELLVAGFFNSDLPVDTRWCITDSLKYIDPTVVNDKIFLPFWSDTGGMSPEAYKLRQHRYDQLAYLAGKIKSREPKVLDFLDYCIGKWLRVSLKGRAMMAVASIYTLADGDKFASYKKLFEAMAGGDFSGIPFTSTDPGDALFLQVSALEALSEIGDLASLEFLRAHRQKWPAEVERQFFITSEEIYWRATNKSIPGSSAGE